MKILKPNTEAKYVPIYKQHFYVSAMDTKEKKFLKEIKVGAAQHTWEWMSFKTDRFVDISDIANNYCTFNNAINRAVNNAYCTVYEFESLDEMISNWLEIKYIDSITTIYKSKEKENN